MLLLCSCSTIIAMDPKEIILHNITIKGSNETLIVSAKVRGMPDIYMITKNKQTEFVAFHQEIRTREGNIVLYEVPSPYYIGILDALLTEMRTFEHKQQGLLE